MNAVKQSLVYSFLLFSFLFSSLSVFVSPSHSFASENSAAYSQLEGGTYTVREFKGDRWWITVYDSESHNVISTYEEDEE